MLTLKTYQQNALDALAAYCRLCDATGDPNLAFYQSTRQTFQQGIPYHEVAELPGLPYVCIRIPTGAARRWWPATARASSPASFSTPTSRWCSG